MIKLQSLSKVEHLYVDGTDRLIFGVTSDKNSDYDIFSVQTEAEGTLREGSLKVGSITSASKVTGILPELREKQMHMMIQTLNSEHVYIIFDIDAHQITRAVPMNMPQGPLVSILMAQPYPVVTMISIP